MADQPAPAPVADWVTIDDLYRDPFPIYDRLRAEGGVHWVPRVGRYLITSYDAVHATEMDQGTFSANEEGSLQIRAMGHSMLRRDDPEHYVERKAWQPALRPGVVKRTWTRMFERNADRYLDELAAKGPGADLVWDFAAPYSAENLRQILGLYNATQEDLQRWSQTLINATGNYADDPDVWAAGERSFDEVDDALDEMLRWHAGHPDDSLLSTLLRIPDYEMPLERVRANIKMTIGGGLNEPRDALGVAAWALLTHPEQRAAVEADPGLWPAVLDEALRWVAPIGLYSRQTTRDVDLAGVRLPAGARLGICVLSANRDTSVWPDGDAFDVRREVKPHLAFSKGVHVCLGAWVARAEVATVGLPRLFGRLRGLDLVPEDPAEIGGWVFRGMTRMPVRWDAVAPAPAAEPTKANSPAVVAAPASQDGPGGRIAIVGAGPAGCFTAQALRRVLPGCRLDVLDDLPVPHGLVRYGVAADHQGTKSVARQFDRLFADPAVSFHGNTRLGTHVTLDELRDAYDAVVLATGVHTDAPLPVPGADHPRVHGAGRLTRLLNGHPDEADPPALGERVVVVGHGNVAMDVVRMLARDEEGLDGTDVDDATRARLVDGVREVHVVGRSAPQDARFDPVMVRELAGLAGVEHRVHGADLDAAPPGKDARLDAVRDLLSGGAGTAAPRVRVEWWFGLAPEAIEPAPDAGERLAVRLRAGDDAVTLRADDVVTAVGFVADPDCTGGAVAVGRHQDGRVSPGVYAAGWLRTGPRGTIGDQRADARTLARAIADDLRPSGPRPGLERHAGATDHDGWRRIDLRERLGAAPGRTRAKLRSRAELLAAARDHDLALPPAEAAEPGRDRDAGPVTVLFGTESGGAEMVAGDLARALGGDVEVRDLADVAPEELDPSRLHLVVCSTYGDGEVPTAARPFHAALVERRPDLSGLRYAVFGMGDRSYTRTYSRGSELVDEALAACGAERCGEYGRHDAGGAVDAADAALEWLDGVLAEAPAPARA